MAQPSGHSRALRERLKEARREKGWTLQECADRVARELGKDKLSAQAVKFWEDFERHPPVDVFAAWCRAVGLRLVVEIVEPEEGRQPVLLHKETEELARKADQMAAKDRRVLERLAELVEDLDEDERFLLLRDIEYVERRRERAAKAAD